MTARSQAVLTALMLAESLSWTGLYERSRLLPFWTRRKRREIEGQYEQDELLALSLPFALNQPTDAFELAPGPHSEWVGFQLRILEQGGGRYRPESALAAWRALADERASLRLTVGQHATVENLRQGKVPPQTGHDNPHYFDDGACFRAIALAITQDGPSLHELVDLDARISNAEDGVWAAQALAQGLRVALASTDPDLSVDAARACLPEGSWVHDTTTRALAVAADSASIFDLIFGLSDEIVNDAYNFGNAAPETLAISLAILRFTRGDLQAGLLAALALARTAGSVAPLVGALCGALGTGPRPPATIPAGLSTLRGLGLPMLRGVDLRTLVRAPSGVSGEGTGDSAEERQPDATRSGR